MNPNQNGQSFAHQTRAAVLQDAVRRLGHPLTLMPPHVRQDVSTVLAALDTQAQIIRALRAQTAELDGMLSGARQTLMVLARNAGAPIDIFYDEIEMLKPSDALLVSECRQEEPPRKFKRFEFALGPADDAAPAPPPLVTEL